MVWTFICFLYWGLRVWVFTCILRLLDLMSSFVHIIACLTVLDPLLILFCSLLIQTCAYWNWFGPYLCFCVSIDFISVPISLSKFKKSLGKVWSDLVKVLINKHFTISSFQLISIFLAYFIFKFFSKAYFNILDFS